MIDRPYTLTDANPRNRRSVPDLHTVLAELASAICEEVPGCSGVGVSVPCGHRVETIFATQEQVRVVDEAQYRQGDGPCLAALRRVEVVRIDDLTGEGRWPLVAAAAADAGFRSVLSVPLLDGDLADRSLAGALNLYSKRLAAFDENASQAALAFTRHAEIVLHHLRLLQDQRQEHAREHHIAMTLQHSLLPTLPQVPGLRWAARYLVGSKAEVGGDWYDLFPLPDGPVGIAVGDVMGHSLAAAAAMGQVRGALRSYAFEGTPPGQVLDRVDRVVQGFDLAPLATAFYARLLRDGGCATLSYANAGHPPPLLRGPDGEVRRLDRALSPVIGAPLSPRCDRTEAAVSLQRDSTLLLYTDGLIEDRHRCINVGIAALESLVAGQPTGIDPEALCDVVLARLASPEPDDDIALLAVQLV